MAISNQVPLEVYLRSDYQPDAEHIDGEIRELASGARHRLSHQRNR